MPTTLPGIIAADVVGGSRRANPSGAALRRELVASLVRAAPPHSDVRDTDFGIRLIFSDAREAYDILKLLANDWMQARAGAAAPLILGLKVGLHAGLSLSGPNDQFMGWNSVGKAFRLAWAGTSDSVRLSSRMYNILEPRFRDDGVTGLHKSFELDQEVIINGVEVPITAFLPTSQFRISIAPPDELMLYLARNPEFTRVMHPEKFEEVVARLFEDTGYHVEMTKRTRDQGVDLIALRSSPGIHLTERYLIQCKRYSSSNHVGVEAVRELAGVGTVEPNTGLVLVTTSSYSAPAKKFAQQPVWNWRLHLKDYVDLQRWLSEYAVRRTLLG